jgi:hypothetical protein
MANISLQAIAYTEILRAETSGGDGIGRPRKNKELQVGRAGRIAIEQEDILRDSLRWQRRKQTIERLKN